MERNAILYALLCRIALACATIRFDFMRKFDKTLAGKCSWKTVVNAVYINIIYRSGVAEKSTAIRRKSASEYGIS